MQKLAILLLALLSTVAWGQSPQFIDCNTQACNLSRLEVVEYRVLEVLRSQTGYVVADSLYFSFTVNDSGTVKIEEEFSTASMLNLIFAKKELLKIGVEMLPSKESYTWVWKISMPEEVQEYHAFSDVKNYPQVPRCSSFNEAGKRACFEYVMTQAKHNTTKITPGAEAHFTLYLHKGQVVAVEPVQVPLDKVFTDKALLTINKTLEEMTSSGNRMNSDDFKINVNFSLSGDSTDLYQAYLDRIDYFYDFPNKDLYTKEVMNFSAKYYFQKPQESAQFILDKLDPIVRSSVKEIKIYGRSLALDSIRAVAIRDTTGEKGDDPNEKLSFSAVESVPVYKGCSKYKGDNDKLKTCFQRGILSHVGKNFQFPEEARKQGIMGRIYVNFVIEKDGSISNVAIVRGVDPLLDYECIRVVSKIPAMDKPAMQRGKPVRMSFTLPINAKLK